MYKYERVNNYPNDPQMQYYSYDVYYVEDSGHITGYTYICECINLPAAKKIVKALNKFINSK